MVLERGPSYSTGHANRVDPRQLVSHTPEFVSALDEFRALVAALTDEQRNLNRYVEPDAGNSSIEEKVWARFAVPILMEYLALHPSSAEEFRPDLFEHVWELIEPHLQAENLIYTRIIPLLHVRLGVAEVNFSLGLSLRRLSNAEIEHWINPSYSLYDLPVSAEDIISVDCAIVIDGDEATVQSLAQRPADNIVSAVRLLTDTGVQAPFFDQWAGGPFRVRRSRGFPDMAHLYVRQTEIGLNQVDSLKTLWNRLQDSPNRALVDLAISRWSSGISRQRNEDRVIDYWVGLESLFCADSTSEIRFRAGLRIAAFLGETPDERQQLHQRMTASYDWRSALVHGGESQIRRLSTHGPLTLLGIEEVTRSALRNSILRILGSDEAFTQSGIEIKLLRGSAPSLRQMGSPGQNA
jgi:Apea-like HEPN